MCVFENMTHPLEGVGLVSGSMSMTWRPLSNFFIFFGLVLNEVLYEQNISSREVFDSL